MSKFEDDLKIAQKTSETELICWLSSIGLCVTKNLDPSFEQKFLTNQQQVHELIFGSNQDGAVNLLFSNIKAGKLKECIAMYQLLYQLSPGDGTYYQGLLKNSQNKHLVEEHLLPTHIQLLLTEQNINSQFGYIFKDNIINNQLHVNSQLLFWINLLNSAVNFKESNSTKEVNFDLLENFQYRLKNKMPSNDYMLSNLTFNPYTILVRRILQSVIQQCFELQSTRGGKDADQVQVLIQLQKMVILLQEYTLFQYIFNINPKELKLSIDQTKKLMRLKHFTLMDTQVQLIYLTILFNSMYGFRLETLFQQFNSIFVPIQQIQTPVVMQRSFFFEAGRQQQILTYPQALFLYLQSAMTNFQNERQYSQLTLLSYCSTLVLYLRWPYAQHEIQLYDCAQRFDQAINWFIFFYQRFTKETYLLNNDSLISSLRQTYFKYFMNLTQLLGKSTYQNQIRQIRQYVPNNEQPLTAIKFMNKPLNYHVLELSEVRQGMSQYLRFNYPFFTYIFKQFLTNIAKIRRLSEEDHQAVIHLISFFISTEESSVFSGLLKINATQQIPSYPEVSQFCLKITQTLKEHDYSLYNCRSDINKLITLLSDYDFQSAQPYVDILQKVFKFEIDYKPSPTRTSYNSNRNSNVINRHSILRKKSPVWQVPQKDHETFILYWIMYQFSCLCDKIMGKEKRDEPQTEWPRKLASCPNFIIFILVLIVIFSVIVAIF